MEVKSGKSEVDFAPEYLLNQRKPQNFKLLTKRYLNEIQGVVLTLPTYIFRLPTPGAIKNKLNEKNPDLTLSPDFDSLPEW